MKKSLALGCGVILLILVCVVALAYWWYQTGLEEPEGVEVVLDLPPRVRVGEDFKLVVRVRNLREAESFELDEIVIDNSFHDAIVVLDVDPAPELRHDMRIAVSVLYKFDVQVPVGSKKVVVFSCRAKREGLAQGDLFVGEGRRMIARRVSLEILSDE